MFQHQSAPPSAQTAAYRGGCLPGLIIPPLSVIVIGILMALLTCGSSTSSNSNESRFLGENPLTNHQENDQNLSTIFTSEIQWWSDKIVAWANDYDLDPHLIATVMQIESCGDPHALSRAGAIGLFQVMPYHFESTENPYSPNTNAHRGLNYLSKSLSAAYGNIRLTLAGYNGGISVIARPETEWATETQRYVYWGANIFFDAGQGKTQSETLQEWLEAGGSSLCNQAHKRLNLP